MSQDCFIGIDQGSSSTKLLVISAEGQVLFQTKRLLSSLLRDGERVEYDAAEILESVQEVLKEAVQSVSASGFVPHAVGLSCQRSTCLIWNETTGKPLSPVISWRDVRGSDLVQQLSIDPEHIFRATGLPLTPYYSASKLRWLKDNIADADKTGTVFGTLSAFLSQNLTNNKRAFIDHTQAARTQLMNIQSLAWDPELLARFGLTDINLPGIVPVIHTFGEIATTSGAVPLSACIGDQQAAMIGLGVLEKGDGGINYGTGGFLMVNTGTSLLPAKGLMASVYYSKEDARYYLLEGSVNAAGDSLEWLRNNIGLFRDYADVDDFCWQAATDVIAFIGLNGTGAPHWEHDISSSIHGMTPQTTAADIVRATVENIAFLMKDIAEEIRRVGLEPGGFAVSGGLSSLSYLVQVQADMLGKELCVSSQQEVSALGAALLAGMAHGTWTPAVIKKMVTTGEIVTPRQNAGASKRYHRWKELHRITRELDKL